MSTIMMVESVFFGSSRKAKDNKLITTPEVSENQAHQDNCMVIALQKEIQERLENEVEAKVICLPICEEPRSTRWMFEGKGDSLFVNDSISVHHFTNAKGEITRRVVILYPMTFNRRGELPKFQFLNKLDRKLREQKDNALELVDLRDFEKQDKILEGLGALNFSYNGEFVYMALSGRSNVEVLDVVCSRDNLNIPENKRFVFTAVLPRHPKEDEMEAGEDVLCHTSLAGWCGKGICAWGFSCLRFATEEEQEAFYHHLEVTYKKIINLSEKEIRAFAGNAYELAMRKGGEERRVLCISESAFKSLSYRNANAFEEWYGRENIFIFYADVLERRTGKSIRSLISVPVTHGKVLPISSEKSAMELARVDEKDAPSALLRR
ncbi:hypothetical protein DQ04_00111270 [Trypanosoma grayi]|uniref:hypothetical protein n=1 Tax=Trypanosoma grayi TaxID=71804 RepID=UPI0004F47D75|nr:hypothetical protein DQ04_00111270 [Trypanosoma grayi]KEG15327.1 hypothetical protein DQ04_00111270 [Trypanosoma grayi]